MNKKIVALILIIIACIIVYRPIDNSKQSFEIYLASGDSEDIDNLVLSSKPVVTDKDILSYKWESHEMVLTPRFLRNVQANSTEQSSEKLAGYYFDGGSKLLGATYKDKFVIVVNGERIYWGHFPKPLSFSSVNSGPNIVDRKNGIAIMMLFRNANEKDERNDKRIYDALKTKGKLLD